MSKILLVEDDINLREIYAARLSAEGHELVLASDGEEALSKAVSEKPSLILLDIMMPKISGFDVLDILRSTPETEDTKVIMLSALSQDSDKERGEKLGVDKYLIKSQITLEDVVETVKDLLQDTVETGKAATSIVTTSGGRLPDENSTPQEDDGQADEQSPVQTDDNTGPAVASTQQAKSQTKPKAADEINDIDAQMQQTTAAQQDSPQSESQSQPQSQPEDQQTAQNNASDSPNTPGNQQDNGQNPPVDSSDQQQSAT